MLKNHIPAALANTAEHFLFIKSGDRHINIYLERLKHRLANSWILFSVSGPGKCMTVSTEMLLSSVPLSTITTLLKSLSFAGSRDNNRLRIEEDADLMFKITCSEV